MGKQAIVFGHWINDRVSMLVVERYKICSDGCHDFRKSSEGHLGLVVFVQSVEDLTYDLLVLEVLAEALGL